jgi:hypothetical protein
MCISPTTTTVQIESSRSSRLDNSKRFEKLIKEYKVSLSASQPSPHDASKAPTRTILRQNSSYGPAYADYLKNQRPFSFHGFESAPIVAMALMRSTSCPDVKRLEEAGSFKSKIMWKKSSNRRPRKSIGFSSVEIREYAVTVGDHPDCSKGHAVTLDWTYEEYEAVDLDDYEKGRRDCKRNLRQLMMNSKKRRHLLSSFHIQPEILKEAYESAERTRRNRKRTNLFFPAQRFEEVLESASRKVNRAVQRSKRVFLRNVTSPIPRSS